MAPVTPGSGRFLQIDPGSPAPIKRIVADLSVYENATPYLDGLIEADGMPYWKHAEIYYPSKEQPDTTVLLPLVHEDSRYVNSILVCKIHDSKITYMLIRGQYYQYYGFDRTLQHFGADLTATMLMRFDYKIFGDSLFLVDDPRLFQADTPTTKSRVFSVLKNKIDPNARIYVYGTPECTGYVHDGDHGQVVGVEPGGSNDYYYGEENCTWVITVVNIPDGGGGSSGSGSTPPPSSGGNEGSGTGIGGSGGGGSTPVGGGLPQGFPPGTIFQPPMTMPPLTPAPPSFPTRPPVTGPTIDLPTIPRNPGFPLIPGSGPTFPIIPGTRPPIIPFPPTNPPPPQTDENGFNTNRVSELASVLASNPDFLVPCPEIEKMKKFGSFYDDLNTFIPRTAAWDRVKNLQTAYGSDKYFLQTMNKAGSSAVNADFYPLEITDFPTVNGVKLDQQSLVEYFRLHIDQFITSGGASFQPYVDDNVNDTQLWNEQFGNALGAMVHIKLANDGTVMLTDYSKHTIGPAGIDFTFTTMYTALDGRHPVSGNRRFGVYEMNGVNVFYIGGMDKITNNGFGFGSDLKSLVGNSGLQDAKDLWTEIRNNMVDFINRNGGSAGNYNGSNDITAYVDHNLLTQYLTGQIDLATLKKALECD